MDQTDINSNVAGTGVSDAGTNGSQQGDGSQLVGTQATGVAAADNAASGATSLAAGILNQTQEQPGAAQQPAAPASLAVDPASNDGEQITLLRKIDSDIGTLTTKVEGIEQRAMRNGAIAGGVAGGIAGGVVATGLSFIRAKLGL